jgi:hypothetical protein
MIRFFTFLACVCLLWVSACSSRSEKGENNKTSCTFKKDKAKQISNTPPFSEATKIEAISFDLESYFKNLEIRKDSTREWPVKIENGVLSVPNILNRHTLTTSQIQHLFEILVFYQGENPKVGHCYYHISDHLLVFYEGKKPFAYLELSFRCHEQAGNNCYFGVFCDEKWEKLASFFPTPKKGN